MDDKLKVAVLVGTTRGKRESIKAARFVQEFGKRYPQLEIILVDPTKFNFPGDGNDQEGKDPRYSKITADMDAFFVVTPEYNHSFPGSLKRMLDSELENYIHKPVTLAGVSNGGWGGVRAVEALVTTVREMGLAVTFTSVYFPRVQDLFDARGHLKEEYKDRYDYSLDSAYRELIWMAEILKWGRANVPKA